MNFILLFGGNSFEHEISIVSAITLKKVLKNISHCIFMDSAGKLFLVQNMNSKHFSSMSYKNDENLEFCAGGFRKKKMFSSEILQGVVINLIHGKSGEDGQVAALLDFYGIEFIGPRIEASAVSFNKELTKLYAHARGIKTLPYAMIRKNETLEQCVSKMRQIGSEIIIKPARLGSSIGISIIKDTHNVAQEELQYALDVGFELDSALIIEPFIANVSEYNLAGCVNGDDFSYSMIEEVRKNEFLDFDKKYLDFSARTTPKASPNHALNAKIIDVFNRIYTHCFEGALVRCDFFVIDDEVYLNEINPVPGSMAHYLFDNFASVVCALARALPRKKILNIQYQYISSIQASKGK